MISQTFFKGKRVTVFGLGLNDGGVGTVEFLEASGVREIVVTDIKTREELVSSIAKLSKWKNIVYVLGAHRPEDFTRTDLVIKNPVIPWTNEYIRLAEKNGIPVEMDSSIFFALCKQPIIGVTGTKGKTTTASLIAHILRSVGRDVSEIGISQQPVLGLFGKIKPTDTVVFELSSFRLSALKYIKKSPHIAVVTNIFPDHLNYYKSMKLYVDDKRTIYQFQKPSDTLIADAGDAYGTMMLSEAPGKTIPFSRDPIAGGVYIRDSVLFVRTDDDECFVVRLGTMKILGRHNRSNVMAATAAALVSGLSPQEIGAALKTFSGVPHRLEFIATKRDVRYVNDSGATIPEAAVAALESFVDEPVILIAGGSDKNLTFDILATAIAKHSKGVVFFRGEGTEKLIVALRKLLPENGQNRRFEVVESMEKAVEFAARNAEPGDTVLLSPGAASFGVFKNEFDRGNQFRKAVLALPGK